jgi:polar amino acid transport system permease protein
MNHFDFTLLLSGTYHDWLLKGLANALLLAGGTLLLAIPLATLIALARVAPLRWLNALAFAWVEAIRNVPLLAHMLFWYFGAPEMLPEPVKRWLYAGDFEAVAALVALTLYTSAYMSEDIRSGLRAVSARQLTASYALGFGFVASMRYIILPQALRHTVPPLLSQALNLWKNTSVATVIGVAELMYQAAKVESATFRSAEAFAFATASYLAVSLMLSALGAAYLQRFPARPQ